MPCDKIQVIVNLFFKLGSDRISEQLTLGARSSRPPRLFFRCWSPASSGPELPARPRGLLSLLMTPGSSGCFKLFPGVVELAPEAIRGSGVLRTYASSETARRTLEVSIKTLMVSSLLMLPFSLRASSTPRLDDGMGAPAAGRARAGGLLCAD